MNKPEEKVISIRLSDLKNKLQKNGYNWEKATQKNIEAVCKAKQGEIVRIIYSKPKNND